MNRFTIIVAAVLSISLVAPTFAQDVEAELRSLRAQVALLKATIETRDATIAELKNENKMLRQRLAGDLNDNPAPAVEPAKNDDHAPPEPNRPIHLRELVSAAKGFHTSRPNETDAAANLRKRQIFDSTIDRPLRIVATLVNVRSIGSDRYEVSAMYHSKSKAARGSYPAERVFIKFESTNEELVHLQTGIDATFSGTIQRLSFVGNIEQGLSVVIHLSDSAKVNQK